MTTRTFRKELKAAAALGAPTHGLEHGMKVHDTSTWEITASVASFYVEVTVGFYVNTPGEARETLEKIGDVLA